MLSNMENMIDMGMATVYGDEDGYSPHMDRLTFGCMTWEQRALRCRRYDCHDDENIWPNGIPAELKPTFSKF